MSRAPEPFPLLATARVVSRYCLPEGELSHVTRLLDAFLDNFSAKWTVAEWTVAESYKRTGSLRLMQYIAARQPAANMDPFYHLWVFNAMTKLVASRGDLTALQWLAESYLPDAFMNEVVNAAATNGHLYILEWLFERHRDRGYWGCIEMCGALENSHQEVVEWLRAHVVPRPECLPMVLRSAGKSRNQAVLQWLCERSDVDVRDAFIHAQIGCHWEATQWLLTHHELPVGMIDWNAAAADGALAYLQFVHSRFPEEMSWPSSVEAAASNGHLEVLQWLYSELGAMLTGSAMKLAAGNGHLNVVQWLHANGCERCDASAMDTAAKNGHLEIVRWLHDNRDEGCSEKAMTLAAGAGHLEIVQWLDANRTEGCSVLAMNLAAQNNWMGVVQWLHEHRSEGCTTLAMDGAAREGHLEMVQWLHTHRSEGCTTSAMDWAAREGHLEMVKWLHVNRREGCTTLALNWAAREGHLEMVKWLHDNRREGWIMDAMQGAAINGHLDVVKWLHANYSEGYRIDTMATAAANGHLGVVKWLYKNDGEVDAQGAMKTAIRQACFDVVMYLHDERWEVPTFHNSTVFNAPCLELTQWLIINYAEQVNGFVSRYCLPEGELSHVTQLLDAFLDDISAKWTLAESYKKTSSLRLMQYIAARQPVANKDPFYGRWVFNEATRLVASCGDLAALQWLAESYLPDALMTRVVHAASMNGYLHILEWLFERHRDRVNWGCVELCWALTNHHTDVVEWLRNHAAPRAECVPMVLRSAGKAGNLGVVQWLCVEYDVDAQDAFVYAQSSCHWETARWLIENCALPIGKINWNAAAADGASAYLQFVHSRFPQEMPWPSNPAAAAAANGHLDILQWLHSELGVELAERTMAQAAENGHLNVVQWLHANNCEHDDASALESAALCGHFEIVRWLHDNLHDECTRRAMTWAAGAGHLEIVQWLHPRLTEGCTTSAMDAAAKNNHMDVVQWLHEHRSEGCETHAMDGAAQHGHLEMVQWLHTHRQEGCTTWAMNTAARHGRLDMVKWLHANRREGCTTTAMDLAARDGHMEMVKWLHDNRNEGCTVKAMTDAAIKGHLEVVKWLHENRSEGCRADTMADAAENGHLEVVKWLHKHRSEVDTQFPMTKAIVNDRMDMVLYLHAERIGAFSFDENTVFRRSGWELTQWLIANYAEQVNGCAFEVPSWDWRFNECDIPQNGEHFSIMLATTSLTSSSLGAGASANPALSWREHLLDEIPVAAEDVGDAITCLLHTILFTRAPGPVRPSEATCQAFPNVTYALCAVGDVSRKVDHAVRVFEETVALGGGASSYLLGGGSSLMAPYGQPNMSTGSSVRGANSGFLVVSFFERKVKKALFGLMSNEEKTVFEKWLLPVTVTSSPAASHGNELHSPFGTDNNSTEAALQNALLHILTAVQSIEHIPNAMYDFEIASYGSLEAAQAGSSYAGALSNASVRLMP
ncbi:hypothetical protein BBJ28_00013346 [Nothophytophthora sp. Chile5]|nr:hypothetical protein BBJ28_00013346 [Nothophytophthora sp. Chile5]